MTMQQFMQSVIDRLHDSASVKQVFGDPVEAEGKTIIPVAKFSYGFGGGMGQRGKDKKGTDEGEDNEGMGGGGGITAKPAGVLEITRFETRYISFEERRKIVGALMVGLLIGMRLARRRRK